MALAWAAVDSVLVGGLGFSLKRKQGLGCIVSCMSSVLIGQVRQRQGVYREVVYPRAGGRIKLTGNVLETCSCAD